MNKVVLLSYKKNDSFKLKSELEEICTDVSVYYLDKDGSLDLQTIDDHAIFICKVGTNTTADVLGDAIQIAAAKSAPLLFVVSEPDEAFLNQISLADKTCYIKEPYSSDELKYILKKAGTCQQGIPNDFRILNESTHDIVFTMNIYGTLFYVSPSVEVITGFTQEEVLTKDMRDLVTEESVNIIGGMIGTFCQKLQMGEPIKAPVFEIEVLHKEGSTKWMELTINPVFDKKKNFRYFNGIMRDISDRKLIEERFRAASECTSDLIYEWDMKSDQVKWFGNIEEALGYDGGCMPETFEGWSEKVHPDDLPVVMGRIDVYRKTGDILEAEYRMVTKDGKIRYWKEHGLPIFDEVTKEIVRTIGVCSDITEKKEAESALKESEEMFRLIAESANDVIWVLDYQGDVLYVSPSLEKLRGFTPEEIKNETMEERFTPESAKLVRNTWIAFFKDFKKGYLPDTPRKIEVEQPCKDGSTVWVEMHINPVLDNDGNFKFFLGISRDISERRERAKQLEKQSLILDGIFDLAPIPMVLLDGNGVIEKMNQECMQTPNINKENAIGKKAGEVFCCSNAFHGDGCGYNDECRSCLFRSMELETLATKRNINKKECIQTLQRPNGLQMQVHIQASTAYINTPDDEKVIMSFENITQRKKAEEEILRSKIEAEQANRTKSEFLATMSHELRTPLNAIIGYSQMLQDKSFGELNTKQRKFAKHTHTSGKHLLDLINDILDLSKVEAGKMDLYNEIFNVNDVMKNVYNIIIPLADKKHINVDFLISEDIEIYADKVRFKQILYNLMSNAIKFTPLNGNVVVKITTENGDLITSVIDNGIGMSEKEQKKLFSPFYQADSSTARKYQGTGLGLSIVKKIIELHSGTIEVESEHGKGSTFTFTIPIKNEN